MKITKLILSLICLAVLTAGRPLIPDYGVGDTVADFKLKNVDGKMVALSDYNKSKGVIVIFDCNTCPYSKAYNYRIKNLHNKYAPQEYPVITVNSNEGSTGESFKDMVNQAKEKKYAFPYLSDGSQVVAKSFGATNTPHVFLLKNTGTNFSVAYIGAIDDNVKESFVQKKYLEDAVEALKKGDVIVVTKTKAVGCGIKWND